MLHQRHGRGLHDEVIDRQLVGRDLVFAFRGGGIHFLARRHQGIEIAVHRQVVMRDQRLSRCQALGDGLAHGIVRRLYITAGRIEQPRIRQRRHARNACATRGGGCTGSSRPGGAGFRALHIGLDDTAARAAAGQYRQVDTLGGGNAPGQGRGEEASAVGFRGRCRRSSGFGRFRFRRDFRLHRRLDVFHRGRNIHDGIGLLTFIQQHRDGSVDLHAFAAFRHQDLADLALVHRFEFHRGLVGLDFGQDVAGFYGVAFFHQPFGQLALLHGGRKRGHQDVGGHKSMPCR